MNLDRPLRAALVAVACLSAGLVSAGIVSTEFLSSISQPAAAQDESAQDAGPSNAAPAAGSAQQARAPSGGTPGAFDFYVLSLSWSPTYCARAREGDALQCAAARPFAFVVHGLWPQYEHGYPSSCEVPPPPISNAVVDGMLDVMPSRGLVRHEWDKHGTCDGEDPAGYFAKVRAAFAAVHIPPAYASADAASRAAPKDIEAAFIAANPGLKADGIAVLCRGRRLSEVRVCLDKSLGFRACPEVDRAACRADQVNIPAARGG
ncbi:ribonuclease T2 family protein [Segnochrobactrum spirostomi]|uniref:Ribonuclease T2 n=1 Tax=Segnochrobactrum spirostomi TaxID=2608987 RepID=A0A6A7Y2S8_9HYPH|nr:ribonuclease T2 [Segnochrobactrum spirostomi]MQT13400.1 ribonuclease T2 [Segnochrobactrum spirostomi]